MQLDLPTHTAYRRNLFFQHSISTKHIEKCICNAKFLCHNSYCIKPPRLLMTMIFYLKLSKTGKILWREENYVRNVLLKLAHLCWREKWSNDAFLIARGETVSYATLRRKIDSVKMAHPVKEWKWYQIYTDNWLLIYFFQSFHILFFSLTRPCRFNIHISLFNLQKYWWEKHTRLICYTTLKSREPFRKMHPNCPNSLYCQFLLTHS